MSQKSHAQTSRNILHMLPVAMARSSSDDNAITTYQTRATNPRWRTATIFKKSKNRNFSATVEPIVTRFGKITHIDPLNAPVVNNLILKSRIVDGGHYEKVKSLYVSNGYLLFLSSGVSNEEKLNY